MTLSRSVPLRLSELGVCGSGLRGLITKLLKPKLLELFGLSISNKKVTAASISSVVSAGLSYSVVVIVSSQWPNSLISPY